MAMKKLNPKASLDGNEIRVRLTEEKGASIEGYYLGSETFEFNGDELTKHRFKNDDGEVLSTIGSFVLNEDLKAVPRGTRTRVTYDGKVKTKKGRMAHAFTIETDDEDQLSA